MDSWLFIAVIQFIVLLLSLSVHESAHAWTADTLGDPTARYLGRVSLNPMVHADMLGTIILPIMGLFTGFMFGWAKPVPVNVNLLRKPKRDHMLVAAAGPVSNMAMATILFIFLVGLKASSSGAAEVVRSVAIGSLPQGDSILTPLVMLAYQGVVINIILAMFNLIPVSPLDGAAVLSGLLPRPIGAMLDHIQGYGFVILLVLLYLGIPEQLFGPPIFYVQTYLIAF